jgi:hypothetical protein
MASVCNQLHFGALQVRLFQILQIQEGGSIALNAGGEKR